MTSPGTREIKNVDLFVNSANRDYLNSVSSTDFRINIVNPPKSKVLLCGLKSVTFPNTVNNVQDAAFIVTSSSGNVAITIPGGNYDISQFTTLLQTRLNATGVDIYVVTVVNDHFQIVSSFAGFVLNPLAVFSRIMPTLGFLNSTSYPSTAGTLLAPFIFDLSGIKNVFIKISQITGFIRNALNVKYNYKFDLTCGYGSVIYFSDQSKYLQEYDVAADNLVSNTFFDIQLVDEYGLVIDNGGLDWNFTLKLTTQNLNQP